MMTKSFALLLLLITFRVSAQDCSCRVQFEFVKTYFEENSPAFQTLKSDKRALAVYNEKATGLMEGATKEQSLDRCNIYLDKYVELLKDHHSGIDLNVRRIKIDLNKSLAVDSLKSTPAYKSFEKIKVDTAALVAQLGSKPQGDIEGLYTNGGSVFFGLMQVKPGNYQGVVLRKNKLMDVGHILLTLTARKDKKFDCVYHGGLLALNFQRIYQTVEVKDGRIAAFGLYKLGQPDLPELGAYEFREVDRTTNYLRLSSFHGGLKQELKSFYDSIAPIIEKKPYLIVDLRDNGGGSEECYFDLIRYIYTRPLRNDEVEVWVTPENIKRYEEAGFAPEFLGRMRSVEPNSFMPQVENAARFWEHTGTTMPRKVALLFNRNTASSAEAMISYFIQSDKVITLGENSGGYLGYGNVMSTSIPCGRYSLRCTTTRYKSRSQFEFVGIPPQILLTAQQDWIKEAQLALKKAAR